MPRSITAVATPTIAASSASVAAGRVDAPTAGRTRATARHLLATLLVLHGLAHAAPGMWAAYAWPSWFVTPLWALAMTVLMAAGFGLYGTPALDRWWRQLAIVGAIASLALLISIGWGAAMVGLVLDPILIITALEWERTASYAPTREDDRRRRSWPRALGALAVALLLAWTAGSILLRPWMITWGTTAAEREAQLPGDELVPNARYVMDHAITVRAPVDAVWPWLAQIGQDRAGFYSYDWLERAVGAGIHNADVVRPEWQQRAVGEVVPAVPAGYLGGVFGERPGWKVAAFVPGRAIVLENWGAFVVTPQDDGTTRLHIRLRGDGARSIGAVVLAPIGLLGFEPAHFIMERGMMLGIRDRAERARSAERARG